MASVDKNVLPILLNSMISGKINGGFPLGRMIEILADESVGKSTLAATAIKSVESMGIGIYFDTENAFDEARAKMLNIKKSSIIYKVPDYLEQMFTILDDLLAVIKTKYNNIPVCVIWDSIASTPAKAEYDAGYEQMSMGLHARLLGFCLRKLVNKIAKMNVCFICINQPKDQIGVYVQDIKGLGGKAPKFHSSVRLYLKRGAKIEADNGTLLGHYMTCTSIKNKIYTPLLKIDIPLYYVTGIQDEFGWLQFLTSVSVVRQSGGWYYIKYNGEKEKAFRSADWLELLKDADIKSFCITMIDGFSMSDRKFKAKAFDSLSVELKDYYTKLLKTSIKLDTE
jgi:recombination protein RecA